MCVCPIPKSARTSQQKIKQHLIKASKHTKEIKVAYIIHKPYSFAFNQTIYLILFSLPLHHSLSFSSSSSTIIMENIGEEYKHYWETNMFLQTQELDSWGLDEALSGYYDSSSPDGAASSAASKNIVSERNRRKKLNERLFALRSVVPNISKMDKASIIKDAIEYIQHLHEQEKIIQAEIMKLESGRPKKSPSYDFEQEQLPVVLRSKKKRTEQLFDSVTSRNSPIEVLELRVTYMGEKTVVVSLTCSKRTDTMVKLCEVFESLKLKIITANITSFSGRLLKTVFIEANEEEKDHLQIKIQTAIKALNDPLSPMSI